jgi:hypothetical protein
MITTVEQYKAILVLFELLESMKLTVSQNTWNTFTEDYGEYEPCEFCDGLQADCNCDDENLHNHCAEYDDEASF